MSADFPFGRLRYNIILGFEAVPMLLDSLCLIWPLHSSCENR